MSANFSDLQQVTTANNADQMMLRLDNGATGPDGFARITVSNLNNVFTSSLTAADAKVKQMSANWDEAYSQVSANSGVFALVDSNSIYWDAAYNAVSSVDYNLESKHFDYVKIQGPYDATRNQSGTNGTPVLLITRDSGMNVDLVQVFPVDAVTTSLFRITTAGSVGINVATTQQINEQLYVNGIQRIDNSAGSGNALTVIGDVFVSGSLSALSATYISTTVTNASAFSISSNGPGPALFVNQYDIGSIQKIAQIRSNAATITFEGNGEINGFTGLSGTGNIVCGSNAAAGVATNVFVLGNNLNASQSNYTYVNNLSSPGTVAASVVNADSIAAGGKTSADWNSTNTTVNSTSSNWNSVYSSVNTQSAANASVYSSVNAQSAANASVYSATNSNSATWSALSTVYNVVSTANTSALTAVGAGTNINAAIVAKGTGATVAQIPNNAASGGNARGTYATDLQKSRTLASQIASGDYSVVLGGDGNTASGGSTFVGGGAGNIASGTNAVVGGGETNTASGIYSAVGGGNTNVASGIQSVVAGGDNNVASGDASAVLGGSGNTASGYASVAVGGASNTASGTRALTIGGSNNYAVGTNSTALGFRASATNYGEFAIANGRYSTVGDNKSSTFLARTTTNASGSAVAYLDGSSEEIILPNNSTYAYTTTIVGLSSHADTSGLHYILRGLAKCNNAGVVTLYNTSSIATSRVPATLNASMSAAGNKLRVVVYAPSTSIHYWHAQVQAEFLQF